MNFHFVRYLRRREQDCFASCSLLSNKIRIPETLALHAPKYSLHLFQRVREPGVVPTSEIVHVVDIVGG